MLAVHSLLTDNGFRCIGSGDEVPLGWFHLVTLNSVNHLYNKKTSVLILYFRFLFKICWLQRDASDECDFGQTLPPDWNTMGELYALHYRKGRSDKIYLLKAMQLGKKLSVYLMVSKVFVIIVLMIIILSSGFNGAETNCRIAHNLGILLMNSNCLIWAGILYSSYKNFQYII